MARIYRPTRVITYFKDAKETESSTYTWLLRSVSFASGLDFANDYANALELASAARVTGVQLSAEVVQQWNTTPPASSDVFRTGALLFGTTEPDDRWILEIPSLRPELLHASGPWSGIQIDLAAPAIQVLANLLIDGDGTVSPTGITGNDLTTLVTGFLRLP